MKQGDKHWNQLAAACEELGREYVIVAEFNRDPKTREYTLFAIWTACREFSNWDGKEHISFHGWDVEHSRTHGYCYHLSSGGILHAEVSGIYWRHPLANHLVREATNRAFVPGDGGLFRKANRTRRLRRLPDWMDNPDPMEWLNENGIQASAVYCAKCRDYLPEDSEQPCSHLWWCETSGEYRGEGSLEEPNNPCADPECYWCERMSAES